MKKSGRPGCSGLAHSQMGPCGMWQEFQCGGSVDPPQ